MPIAIFADYIVWHFVRAPREIFKAWKQVFLYSFTYFSTAVLFKTLFSPWHRSAWSYPKAFDIGKFLETFLSNIISRVLGAFVRIFMILLGITGEICIFFVGMGALVLWVAAPFLIAGGFFYGLILIF